MKELNLLERSIVAPFLNEEDKETIAIYPGAFKPPHRGHLSVVEKANAVADKTIILISSAPREDVEAEESLKIWELYTKDMPNVEVKISERFSPVAEAYSLFKHNPEKNFVMAIGKGEVSRLDNLEKYTNAKPFDAGTLEDLSATRLRKAIREGDTETIRKFIPENISVEEYLNAFDQAPVNEEDEFELDFCDKCMQMKNHKDGECQKCKMEKEKEEVKEDCYPENFLQDSITSFAQYMEDSGMQIAPPPRVEFVNDDEENAEGLFGKTAYYNPEEQVVVLYTLGRHPKDILRSFAHEMIHHVQNLEGRLGGINTTNTNEDDYLDQIEREAYEHGNMTFRNWTDSILHENVNEAVVSDNEIEALIAKAVKKPSSEVDLDAIEKGEELKEGAGVATVLALPVLLELASKLSNKIYRKLGLTPEEAKLYKAKKKEINDIKEKHNISKIIDFDPNDTPEQKAAKQEIKKIEKFIGEKFPSFVGDILHYAGHKIHQGYTYPIRLLLKGAAFFVPSGKGYKIKDPKFREKVANVIYAVIMTVIAGIGILDALSKYEGVRQAYTAIVELTEGGASLLEVAEGALEAIGAIGELNTN